MTIDWELVVKIAVPLATFAAGKWLDHWLTKRSKLVTYFGHASAFTVRGVPPHPDFSVNTHAIVVANVGKLTATNVRICHLELPENYQLFPAIPHSIECGQGTYREILIPKLVPNEQVTVSYLYYPPLFVDQIHVGTKSDEGFAKVLNVLPTPQMARWKYWSVWAFAYLGAASALYIVIELLRKLV
jgi:hypothetical protein